MKIYLVSTILLLGSTYLPAQESLSLTVSANMDIYRAGNYNDGSDGIDPVVFSFPAKGSRTISFPSIGGAWSCNTTVPPFNADGTNSTGCYPTAIANSVGPFGGYQLTDFSGALAGMFLDDTLPASAPAALRFYQSNNSMGGTQTDFKILRPQIGQVFFIGDGLTGTDIGTTQTFVVPSGATHLYLGFVDSCLSTGATPGCFSDNVGSLNVTARLQYYILDWYEPTLTTAVPQARCCSSITYDASHYYALLFGGGIYDNGRLNDTWVWFNGWYQLSPANSPPGRASPGLAEDPTTATVVLFGGDDSAMTPSSDTWTWNGVTWTQQFPPVSPPPRSGDQSMVYDPATGTVVLFGGLGAENDFGDTWEWNGSTMTWTQLSPATSPAPRRAPLVYDTLTGTVVLFGGDTFDGGDYNDTWTWDGTNWTQQFPATSPPARGDHSMAYDAALGQVVVFGGYSATGQVLNDTWAWNGNTWTQLNLPNQPSAVYAANMTFDPFSDGVVLFGGLFAGNSLSNDTSLLLPVRIP